MCQVGGSEWHLYLHKGARRHKGCVERQVDRWAPSSPPKKWPAKFSSLGPWGGGPEVKEEEQALIFIPEPVRKSLSRKEGVKVLRTTSYVTNKHLRSAQPRADLRSTNENHHDMPSHTLQLRPNRDGRDTAAREDLQRTAGSQVKSQAGASTPQSKLESRALHTSPRGHTVTQ